MTLTIAFQSRLCRLIALVLSLSCTQRLAAQEIKVESDVAANPADGGWYPSYEVHVDPVDGGNMMICGSKWNAKDNASYGFVSFSADAGKTWQQALEDKSSQWVSEESCAYGVNGIAYFVADASKVIDGGYHHDLGTTRIYVSHDGGRTWKIGIETGWTDYSASVVDVSPGPNQNRLYVYFNSLGTFYGSTGQIDKQAAERTATSGTRIGLISYKDGDEKVVGPFTSEAMAKENYHGSYPAPARVLKDGSIVTIFTTKRRTDKNAREFMVEAVRTSPDRTALEAPVKVVDSLDNPDTDSSTVCGGYYLGSASTYDSVRDKLYYAYSDVRNKKCRLFIATSIDGGRSWKNGQVYLPRVDSEFSYGALSIAVNKDGVLAMMWEKTPRSGCWTFAASSDDGKSLLPMAELGTCNGEEMKPSLLTSNYLWTSFFQADPANPSSVAHINLRNTRNAGEPHEDGIAVTPDGEFHPIWIDAGNGTGELRIAAIRVVPTDALIAKATKGMENITSKIAILYGGDQNYTNQSKRLTLKIRIKNTSDQPLHGPFRLVIPSLYKDYGYVEIANAENGITGAGSVWDISSCFPSGTIAPGATSEPFQLEFHYLANPDQPRASDDILGIEARVYAASVKSR